MAATIADAYEAFLDAATLPTMGECATAINALSGSTVYVALDDAVLPVEIRGANIVPGGIDRPGVITVCWKRIPMSESYDTLFHWTLLDTFAAMVDEA